MGTVIQPKLTPGDVVRLKSGSPSMTVETVAGKQAMCSWFVDQIPHHETFSEDALTIDEKGSKK
ncbi:hypothetical protein [Aeromonas phage 51]|uniref:DUF2158 domain-containing protein n=3 Tax=Popoffvirus pv56 TaxID=2560283 RepID=A0A219YC53_9CAUD|nr:hypothetical protein F394_gp58 [Aeromonas phage vB_AsaM-56]AFC22654.1 hypothetical protein AsaM-56_0058 [Aeromonas phage vB_AsaM-56]APU01283.1 hypothetical protein [Aeromonas phage 51]APU01367.1 hypothetical protein [Aeromonas phage 56]